MANIAGHAVVRNDFRANRAKDVGDIHRRVADDEARTSPEEWAAPGVSRAGTGTPPVHDVTQARESTLTKTLHTTSITSIHSVATSGINVEIREVSSRSSTVSFLEVRILAPAVLGVCGTLIWSRQTPPVIVRS